MEMETSTGPTLLAGVGPGLEIRPLFPSAEDPNKEERSSKIREDEVDCWIPKYAAKSPHFGLIIVKDQRFAQRVFEMRESLPTFRSANSESLELSDLGLCLSLKSGAEFSRIENHQMAAFF